MVKRLIITLLYAISILYTIFIGIWLMILYMVISFFIWLATGKSINLEIAEHLAYGPLSWFMGYVIEYQYG